MHIEMMQPIAFLSSTEYYISTFKQNQLLHYHFFYYSGFLLDTYVQSLHLTFFGGKNGALIFQSAVRLYKFPHPFLTLSL